MSNGQRDQGKFTIADTTNLLYGVSRGIAACFWVPIRRNFGIECPGWAGLFALVFMLVYGTLTRERLVLWYMAVWFCLLIHRRFESRALVKRGVPLHSKYAGFPWLGMMMPFVKSESAGKAAEVVFCFAMAGLLWPISGALTGFFFLGGIALATVHGFERQLVTMRLRRMRDAEIEQRFYADAHRGRRSM